MTTSVLVLALGNPLLGDEGVGPKTLSRLSREHRLPETVELVDGWTAGLSLAPRVSGASKVLVLDAVRAGRPPGTLVKLDGSKLPRQFFCSLSPHQMGFRDIVSASRLMGGPDEIVLLGVEPASLALSTELSEPVERALDDLLSAALAQLGAWGVETRAAVATAACPSARPPSLGGTA